MYMKYILTLILPYKQAEPKRCYDCHTEIEPTSFYRKLFRRSSTTSTTSNSSQTSYNIKRQSSVCEIERALVKKFVRSYQYAVDEMAYAIESQGSIYYNGDYDTATEAIDICFNLFEQVMKTLNPKKAYRFKQEWDFTMSELQSRLKSLPPSTLDT
ncbi:hypothetical protein BDB01DRAFT_851375 [Pilobolus umbonatus]|nr:hypothetical protein BDB01DRAFT_851375 [Pilobolus umbonatus]